MEAQTPPTIEELKKELQDLKDKNEKLKLARKIRAKRYRNSKKGKEAIKRANKKYYKPTGKKAGRPRKIT